MTARKLSMLDFRICKCRAIIRSPIKKLSFFILPGEDVSICCSCKVFWTNKKHLRALILLSYFFLRTDAAILRTSNDLIQNWRPPANTRSALEMINYVLYCCWFKSNTLHIYFGLFIRVVSLQPHKEQEAENIKLVENTEWTSTLFLHVNSPCYFLPDPGSTHRRLVRGQTTSHW